MQRLSKLSIQPFVRGVGVASAVAVLGANVSCSDSTGVGGTSSQIAFTTSPSATADAALSTVPVIKGGHTLDLTAATLTITRAELKRAKTDACPGDEDDDDDDDHPTQTPSTDNCGELKIGPTTVDLPLTGTMTTLPANAIPAGTFREFELRISNVELKGTFDGKSFDVSLPIRVKREIEFATPLVVTAGVPTLITVNVPVNTWLVNSDGSLVDPAAILTTPSLMAQVRARIAASLRAFEDRDHDGHEDHDGKEGHG